MNIFLNLPPFLREWALHSLGNTRGEITPARRSIELALLRAGLRAPHRDETPMVICPEGWTPMAVPQMKGVNLDSRNFLPAQVRKALEAMISSRFEIDLWQLIRETDFREVQPHIQRRAIIEAWMEAKGISLTEANYWAVEKRVRRQLRRYANIDYHRRRRGSNHRVADETPSDSDEDDEAPSGF